MAPDGSIKLFENMTEDEKLKAIPIPVTKFNDVKKMSRQQRRKWYRDQDKEINNSSSQQSSK